MSKWLSHLPAFAFYSFVVSTFAFGLYVIFWTPTAHAYVPPRSTVELVKMFACDQYDSKGYTKPEMCAADLESKANIWLQEKQPGIRIVHRELSANKYSAYLAIFYEVSEWRTKQQKLPAEATPR